jgi:hypothetical protein
LFPTPVTSNIPNSSNAPIASYVSTPPTHQPHVDLSPSSPIRSPSLSPSSPSEISKVNNEVDKKNKKQKEKKKKNQKGAKPPTTSNHVGSKQPAMVNRTWSVDKFNNIKMNNPKLKFPCSLCKGNHFLRDFPSLPKVLEMWSSTSSDLARHVGDTPSASDITVGKRKRTIKFPCLLCKGDHYSHLFPRMDEGSYLLENIQLPTGYQNISPRPSLVDGLVNIVPFPLSLVDPVVNIVSSSVEPKTQGIVPVPSSIIPTLHLKSETKVVDSVLPLVDPTPPLKSAKVVNMVPSLVGPTPPLKSAKVVDLVLPDLGGYWWPPTFFSSVPKQFSGNFGNLLFLVVFHFQSRFEALNDVF